MKIESFAALVQSGNGDQKYEEDSTCFNYKKERKQFLFKSFLFSCVSINNIPS